MDRQPKTRGIAGQLRSALASLPPARGLLPLILLLLVWQLVQPGRCLLYTSDAADE